MTDIIILLTDDDPGHSKLIKRNLRRNDIDFSIKQFTDGESLLDFLYCHDSKDMMKPDKAYVLLLDIRMPKIDGIDTLKRIKSDPLLKIMPVIMLTTNDDPREVRKCHELGCNHYITKPINYDDFHDTIAKLGNFLKTIEIPTIKKTYADKLERK